MKFRDLWRAQTVAFMAEGEGAGGGDADTQAGGGNDTQGGGADTQAGGGNDTQGGGGASKWWEGQDYSAEERQWLAARGLTEDDPAKILPKLVKGHRAAEIRLGKGVDSILDKPKEGQALAEWMRENAIFGLPETEDGYKIDRPKDLAEGIAWDGDLEAQARKVAFEQGLTPAQLQAITGLYASRVGAIQAAAETAAAEANTRMMTDLARDWGDQLQPKLAVARQAAGVLGEKAGLDKAGVAAVAAILTEKAGGDAAAIRMFAALGEMMGEDRMIAGQSAGIGMTPAEARAKAAQMRAPDGAYAKAVAAQDRTEIARLRPEMDRLDKIAAGK